MSSDGTSRIVDSESFTRALAEPPFVVGIGASAGGLEALERFFDNVPRESGAAFVLIQHLSPDFRSLMDELLARHTDLPIHLVEDGMQVQADHVYLIPPKKEMIISGGRLLLSERDRQHELSLPIDVFFRSLAQECGRRAVAVILSGGGSDGSRGVRAVHDAGGLVIVQDFETAQFDGMPKTARDAGVANWVLPPQQMPRVIVQYVKNPGDVPVRGVRGAENGTIEGLSAVYRMLRQQFGIDFTHYKPSTITRRIERRLRLARAECLDEYVERLAREREELDVLYRDLLIGVTRFFRNEEVFDALGARVLPELMSSREAPMRVWVSGCATGEEVYSLAILLDEVSCRLGAPAAKIFATDVHQGSLDLASRASYDDAAMIHVSRGRRERYFRRRNGGYEVVPDLRQNIVFAAHNVIKDPPFTRVDLISCRNLLIYLQPAAQDKTLSLFHFALSRGGVLVLGPSESPGRLVNDFVPVSPQWRIYRKHTSARIEVSAVPQSNARPSDGPRDHVAPLEPMPARPSMTQLLAAYDSLLDRFMPPSLLVSDKGDLLQSFAGASRFLKVRDGRHGVDILGMVEPELRLVLAGGLRRAMVDGSSLVFTAVHATPGDDCTHSVAIERVRGAAGNANLLVSFQPSEALRPAAVSLAPLPREVKLDEISREQIGTLQAELSSTKENLQAAIEQLQTSNEELQAANEELLASNEELQSTNEELQSVNEELYTVNAEYQRKITELTELTNDMDNLLASTDIGTVFLDKHLRIRKFTAPIAAAFNLLSQDVGRSIETFHHDMGHPALADDLRRVLATGEQVEREFRDREGRSYFLRLLPYRARGDIDGVVLTLIDVSGLKAAEDALFHERYLLNSLLSSVPDAIYFKDARGKFIRANEAMAARLGLSEPAELVGKTALELPDQSVALALHQHDDAILRSGNSQHYHLERFECAGAEEWDLVTRVPLRDSADGVVGVIGIFRDVTQQTRAEQRNQEEVRRRDQFLAMLSHELRNPLGAVVTATALLKKALEPQRPRMLEILERQSQQMARLLDDLLEASRVTEDKIELRKQTVDLRMVTQEAADAARSLMEARGLEFAVEIDSEPIWVDGDPARLQQIETNLLNNAAKYTPSAGHVWLSARREHDNAIVRVRDDGVGIGPDMLETVFDLFVQAGRTLDRAQGGIGVGLTLVRALVQMHGGTVVAKSDGHARGAEFMVSLPATTPSAEDGEPERDARRGLNLRSGAKVAVIEDNFDSREMLREALSQAGFSCRCASDGAEGLTLIETIAPDAVLVDVGLPVIDGFELARRVRADPRLTTTRLIAVTGYGQRADRIRALAAGFDLHLVKPVDPFHLVRILTQPSLGVMDDESSTVPAGPAAGTVRQRRSALPSKS